MICFQLYDATGNELCITAVNVNMLSLEYFHPKTTPDIPINQALRMSVSIPGKQSGYKSLHTWRC